MQAALILLLLSPSTTKSMTNAKLALVMAAVLIVGLLTAGAGVMGHSATRHEQPARGGQPSQEVRQDVAASHVTQGPPGPAATKPAADQGPLIIQVNVADPQGRRLFGADVAAAIFYARNTGSGESVFERTRTDGAGQAQLEVARERPGAWAHSADVWAYQPGRAIAVSSAGSGASGSFARKASPWVIPLTLDQPAKCTITVLDADDRPIAGLRLAPHRLRRTDGRGAVPIPPDAWLEPLTATTDAKGTATLSYLPGNMVPVSIRVAGPGVAPHLLPLSVPQGGNAVLKLGRSGRVVGIVHTTSGVPLADVPVELWVKGPAILWSDFGDPRGSRRIIPDEILRLDQEPLKTGSQGAFQTQSTLLSGSNYRVSIRQGGFAPFVSDWVTLNGERAAIPQILLRPLQKLTGQIKDRQGRAVAGARVSVPAGGLRAVTDAQGRFALAGINTGKTVILVEQTGFRLEGWLFDLSSRADAGALTLVRASEIPEKVMKPLADPIPPEESRALADRLLEPYVHGPMENDDDEPRLAAISALSAFDLDRALELLQNGEFRDEDLHYQLVRESVGAKLAMKDPARAEAMVESISDPAAKVRALTRLAKALPASERGRKQALLERATTLLRDRLQQANAVVRLQLVTTIAEQWLDMGERDRARLLLQEGTISSSVFLTGFLGQLARLEPDQVLARLQKLPTLQVDASYRDRALAEVAVQLAIDHAVEAEQVFNLREGRNHQLPSLPYVLRLCRRLAQVDPTRARRVAASLGSPGTRAGALAYVALGLAENDTAGATEAMDRAIQEIDRLRGSGPRPEPVTIVGGFLFVYETNPAAMILPVTERIAPERLREVFWRAVALHPRIKTDREDQLRRSRDIGFECALLARYDRRVAAALFEPMDSYLRSVAARTGSRGEFDPSVITAKGCIDPRAAVALLESMSPPRDSRRSDPAHLARLRLAEMLGVPSEDRWLRLWGSMGARLDD